MRLQVKSRADILQPLEDMASRCSLLSASTLHRWTVAMNNRSQPVVAVSTLSITILLGSLTHLIIGNT